MTFKTEHIVSLFIYIKNLKRSLLFLRIWGMDTTYSAVSMALYLVFFSCLATTAMASWKIFDHMIQFPIF